MNLFNRNQLVQFGMYLLSDERKETFSKSPFEGMSLEERLSQVHHADVENFIDKINNSIESTSLTSTKEVGNLQKKWQTLVQECKNGVAYMSPGAMLTLKDWHKIYDEAAWHLINEITHPSPTVKEGESEDLKVIIEGLHHSWRRISEMRKTYAGLGDIEHGIKRAYYFLKGKEGDLGAEQQQDRSNDLVASVRQDSIPIATLTSSVGNSIAQDFAYEKAVSHFKNHPDFKIGWEGHFHLFLGALFPDLLFSQREKIIDAAAPMLIRVGAVQASVATEDSTGNPKLATKFYTQEEVDKLLVLLNKSRDLHLMCTLIDKSGQCDAMVEEIDAILNAPSPIK